MTLSEFFSCERGAQAKLAHLMTVAAPLLSQWASGDRQVPDERCTAIELHTGGSVTVESLRPDRKWVRVKDKQWPNPAGRPLLDLSPTAPANDEQARAAS